VIPPVKIQLWIVLVRFRIDRFKGNVRCQCSLF
jgi:hypothetical protein